MFFPCNVRWIPKTSPSGYFMYSHPIPHFSQPDVAGLTTEVGILLLFISNIPVSIVSGIQKAITPIMDPQSLAVGEGARDLFLSQRLSSVVHPTNFAASEVQGTSWWWWCWWWWWWCGVYMCIRVYVYRCVYIYVCICVYVCMCVYVYMCICGCIRASVAEYRVPIPNQMLLQLYIQLGRSTKVLGNIKIPPPLNSTFHGEDQQRY